jgi:hypothetical protein
LLAAYPHIDKIVFSNHLLQVAGRKFGAASCCHRGIGGMQPLTDRLKMLEEAALKQFTPGATQDTSYQVAAVQCNVPAHMLQTAQGLISQLQAQATEDVPLLNAGKAANNQSLQQVSVLAPM